VLPKQDTIPIPVTTTRRSAFNDVDDGKTTVMYNIEKAEKNTTEKKSKCESQNLFIIMTNMQQHNNYKKSRKDIVSSCIRPK
jgi:hypothetical protein